MSPRPPASPAERVDWLRLARAENVGPVTFFSLLRRFGTARAALDALPGLARRGGAKAMLRIPTQSEAEDEIAALAALGGRLVIQDEAEYSQALAAADGAPPVIAALGRSDLLKAPALALVGARNASAAGIRMAQQLSAALGKSGFVIVSGLARGIDTAAHRAALGTGTIGVLAGGIDVVYPPENQPLYDAMRADGAILSEMPLGATPQARHFPRRNRIISGLALATVVIEAAEHSGSLITARFALDQGREVMAVPGSPLDPRCRGANRLIREGAVLVQDAQDVIDALGSRMTARPAPDAEGFSESEKTGDSAIDALRPLIEERLGPTPVEIDELIRQTGAPASAVAVILIELELAGRLERHPGQRVSLKPA